MEKASEISHRLWTARLDPSSPRYATWLKCLGGGDVPLKSCSEHQGNFTGHGLVACYRIDVAQLSPEQLDRFVAHFAEKAKADPDEVRRELLGEHGIPIWTEDVCIAMSLRAFV